MAYIVVKHFTDLQDHGYKYAEGDIYPREGYVPSEHEADDIAGYEELCPRAKQLGEQEERRARLVGRLTEGLQDGVDGGDAVTVIVG